MTSRRKIRDLKGKLVATVTVAAAVALMAAVSCPCPIHTVTGLPCPGCGMTRAVRAALHLDLAAAFSHHAMFWSLPLLYIGFLYDGQPFAKRWQNAVFWGTLALGFLLNWAGQLYSSFT